MREIIDLYRKGLIDEDEAQGRLWQCFYERGEEFMIDISRHERLGFPEVIFAEGKSEDQLLQIVERILAKGEIALLSHVSPERQSVLKRALSGNAMESAGRLMVVGAKIAGKSPGTVGIITAGTSDIPYAKECSLILESIGTTVVSCYDAGVAGIHRPYLSLREVKDADVLIVLAGMEGALPTMIASITDKPVIAVPTPVGYGVGGCGVGAFIGMLQTCAPGVLVVNIGNTVGAAAGAVRILRTLAKNRL